ncbi:MAG: ABC transporter ATP-binding protein/permease [Propionibacteriaceae bacterium]
MARGFQGAMMRGFGARDHLATVLETQVIAPHFRRVRMQSPTLFDDVAVEPTAWLRFWFPDPDGGDKEFQRAYTLVESDPDSGEFAVDFVLHQPAGPASAWAASAGPGSTVTVSSFGSSRFVVPDDLPAGFLLIGDSASIPAMNSILAVLPADVSVELYLERHSPDDDLIPLGEHPRLRLHWVDRSGDGSLAAAVEARDWSDWFAWIASESGSFKKLRTRLKEEFGFPKQDLHCRAYWFHGRAFGSSRGPAEKEVQPEVPPAGPTDDHDQEDTPTPPAKRTAGGTTRGQWRSQASRELFRPVKPQLITSGVLQGIITLLQLAPFLLLVELARQLLTGADPTSLRGLAIGFVVLLGVGALLSSALVLWLHLVDARFSAAVRRQLLDKLSRLPLGWFDQRGSGGVTKLVQDDTLSLHYLVTHAIPDAVAAVVAPLAVLIYLFVVDWRLALVLLLPILVYVFSMYAMIIQSGSKITEHSRWTERMQQEAAAFLEGQPVIRVFGGAAASSFQHRLDGYLEFLNGWQRPFTGKKTFMDLVTRPTTNLWLICAAGTIFVVTDSMAPSTLLPFLVLGTTFGARLLGVGYGLAGIRDGVQAARRIAVALGGTELLTQPEREAGTASENPSRGTVAFDRVGFGYRPGVPVLRDVSVALRPGTVTALVGPSGSGKSTLAGLLARFHDVDEGAIRIDDRDLRTLTADELYTRVGFVFQDVQLIHGTVRDNIALAAPDASTDEIHAAAEAAHLHDRILRLAHGYDTRLGAGSQLSGGEAQRLSIARALLADTPILVLDEATAFADPESEFLVQQALQRLTHNRTVLVIAHRLHTITAADQIVVLDEGRVVEVGTHEELLARDGRYRLLWDGATAATTQSVMHPAAEGANR